MRNKDIKIGSPGGKATAIVSRRRAIEKYYIDPKRCKYCEQIIHPKEKDKVAETKRRSFCSHACSAIYNNIKRGKNAEVRKERRKIKRQLIRKLKLPKFDYLLEKTKQEVFSNTKWQSARSTIRKHAAFVFSGNKKDYCCEVCKYDKHVEICHIKAVKDFDKNAKIKEINAIENLVGLCPNHHWEFDNGLLELKIIGT